MCDTSIISQSRREPTAAALRVSASNRERNADSGPADISRVGGETSARQPVREPKAFTGRGCSVDVAHEERQLRAALDRVHSALQELSAKTRAVRGRRFYLMLQKRKPSGALFLRWRDTGAHGGHIPWHTVPEFIAREPASLHAWYERINQRAMELNDEEQLCRLALSLYQRRQARLRGDDSLDVKLAGRAKRRTPPEK